jgi:predicted nuclease of predicted toxin-antitoxin system
MRILLDECLPRKLKSQLPGHEVVTVPEAGWAGKSNGELLALIPGEFEAFVTIDQNLVHQQRLSGLPFAIVVLSASSSSFADILPLAPALREVLEDVSPGDTTIVP